MSLLEAPYLIESPTKGSAICHKIIVPPTNRSALVNIVAPDAFNMNFMESIWKYIVQTCPVLLEITMAATTTWFTGDGLGRRLLVWLTWPIELFKQSFGSNIL